MEFSDIEFLNIEKNIEHFYIEYRKKKFLTQGLISNSFLANDTFLDGHAVQKR